MNKANYCVIMAGGIGSRFWPVSTTKKPKQFLDITGTGYTLIQQTFYRFSKIIPQENIFVVTNEEHKNLVKEQIPEIPLENILTEPMRRNTAPCIAYANFKIKLKNPNANIVVTPSDHLIINEELFLENIKSGLNYVNTNESLLTLGIHPDRPATGYGYIQINNEAENGDFKKVKTFTEKPHLELAKFFVKSREFLWNSGIFMWKLTTIENAFLEFIPELQNLFEENIEHFNTNLEQDALNRIYSDAKNISIDFAIMEKADNVFVLPVDFGWSDLGTWNSLFTIAEKDNNKNAKIGKYIITDNSERNYIHTDNDKLVILNDMSDYIVINTDNALLVCKRENEEQVKDLLSKAKLEFGDEII
jgi:mannose-1-phosphate guanylyltransferase